MVGHQYENIAYDIAFRYNSPLLIMSAICVFIPFMRLEFYNKFINTLASSCLAIYLIHSANLFIQHPIKDAALFIQSCTTNICLQIGLVMLLGVIICITAILIDNALNPFWKLISRVTNHMETTKLGVIARNWAKQ